jgi:hypothetical protein
LVNYIFVISDTQHSWLLLLAGTSDEITTMEQVFDAEKIPGYTAAADCEDARARWPYWFVYGRAHAAQPLAENCAVGRAEGPSIVVAEQKQQFPIWYTPFGMFA